MTSSNVFLALSKYGSRELENYLTESFVFLLGMLLERETVHGLAFVNKLCGVKGDASFTKVEEITISTQITVEDGRPDIEIRGGARQLFYVEVKHDAQLGDDQLEYYKNKLDESQITCRGLVLLTRSKSSALETTLSSDEYNHLCWYDIHRILKEILYSEVDEVCSYFIRDFNLFLESKQMSLEQVGWEFIKGVPGLVAITNMLEVAILDAIPGSKLRKTAGWSWRGFIINNSTFCGIRFDDPLIIVYENNMGNSPSYKRDLSLSQSHFFSLNQAEQLESLIDFLQQAENQNS